MPQHPAPAIEHQPNVPWLQNWNFDVSKSNYLKAPVISDVLSSEMYAFTTFMMASTPTGAVRQHIVERVENAARKVVNSLNAIHAASSMNADEVKGVIYGSSKSGLCLPFSDLDLNLLVPKAIKNTFLRQLSVSLRSKQIATETSLILTAKVPIIKFTDALTGLSVDVSLNEPILRDADWAAQTNKEDFRILPLVLVLKLLLRNLRLGNPSEGGLAGFALNNMVVAFLRLYPRLWDDGSPENPSIGELLMDFLKYFADFDYQGYRLSAGSLPLQDDDGKRTKSRIYKKRMANTWPREFSRLVVDHPLNHPITNITFTCHLYPKIARAFANARAALKTAFARRSAGESVLASIISISRKDCAIMQKVNRLAQHIAETQSKRDHSRSVFRDHDGNHKKYQQQMELLEMKYFDPAIMASVPPLPPRTPPRLSPGVYVNDNDVPKQPLFRQSPPAEYHGTRRMSFPLPSRPSFMQKDRLQCMADLYAHAPYSIDQPSATSAINTGFPDVLFNFTSSQATHGRRSITSLLHLTPQPTLLPYSNYNGIIAQHQNLMYTNPRIYGNSLYCDNRRIQVAPQVYNHSQLVTPNRGVKRKASISPFPATTPPGRRLPELGNCMLSLSDGDMSFESKNDTETFEKRKNDELDKDNIGQANGGHMVNDDGNNDSSADVNIHKHISHNKIEKKIKFAYSGVTVDGKPQLLRVLEYPSAERQVFGSAKVSSAVDEERNWTKTGTHEVASECKGSRDWHPVLKKKRKDDNYVTSMAEAAGILKLDKGAKDLTVEKKTAPSSVVPNLVVEETQDGWTDDDDVMSPDDVETLTTREREFIATSKAEPETTVGAHRHRHRSSFSPLEDNSEFDYQYFAWGWET
ncbi:hypothetical protein SeMB42_g02676 [Synchytrium endobioticum]|uniref:Poly(A) RNA polymerase mitochondrial-like central palm domain-containing protein n=1 Tax=Synchytrium endobioticum TaxID=286115 RepID=A0A507DCA0_9FUNG|nr:hypothetical protein SeLEV6574_g02112 [Synchytrium endobioticum]TPX49282.1 hypothetical protein SeMB42_g02676 [Synchytrium endobioticum]